MTNESDRGTLPERLKAVRQGLHRLQGALCQGEHCIGRDLLEAGIDIEHVNLAVHALDIAITHLQVSGKVAEAGPKSDAKVSQTMRKPLGDEEPFNLGVGQLGGKRD